MIDIHTHVLAGVDHGANTINDSLTMLSSLEESGVKEVYLTSHYYSDTESVESFKKRYNKAFEELLKAYSGPITLKRGAEVLISPYFAVENIDKALLLENSEYILVELPFWNKLPFWVFSVLERLLYWGVKPIIAHVERYPSVRTKKRTLKKLRKFGAFMHVDSDAVKDDRFAEWCIKKGYCDFLASDYHIEKDYVSIAEALAIIEEKYGSEKAEALRFAPETLLEL